MLDPEVVQRIRNIFLQPRTHVSISAATVLLGWSREEMKAAIGGGELELMTTPLGKWVGRQELIARALDVWPVETIEEALGAEAAGALPAALRTRELHARVPRYQVAMLEYLAGRERTTVSDVLSRELQDIASERADELCPVIPGFADALECLGGEAPDVVC